MPLLWHPKLNQIIAGNADGASYVMYDPTMSEKGAMICTAKRAPKRAALSYTGGAMHIMTPHALPMFKVRVRVGARVRVRARARARARVRVGARARVRVRVSQVGT